jgi:endonuclease YncB( thermonuclease family)
MRSCLKPVLVISVGFFILFSNYFVFAADYKKPEEKTVVTKVIDGDSLEVRSNDTLKTIRLYGIDSPEWKQPFSRKAKSYLEKRLLKHEVELEVLYDDRFGRSVALVYHRGINVNQLLVQEGLAWVHVYYCHKEICENWKRLEQIARSKKIGLWQDNRPVPPWVWKRVKR